MLPGLLWRPLGHVEETPRPLRSLSVMGLARVIQGEIEAEGKPGLVTPREDSGGDCAPPQLQSQPVRSAAPPQGSAPESPGRSGLSRTAAWTDTTATRAAAETAAPQQPRGCCGGLATPPSARPGPVQAAPEASAGPPETAGTPEAAPGKAAGPAWGCAGGGRRRSRATRLRAPPPRPPPPPPLPPAGLGSPPASGHGGVAF